MRKLLKNLITFCSLWIGAIVLVIVAEDSGVFRLNNLNSLAMDWMLLFEKGDFWSYNQDIAVILIDDVTLLDYPARSPTNRVLLSELIDALNSVRVRKIGLDYLFDRVTIDDRALFDSISRSVAKIVVGTSGDSSIYWPYELVDIEKDILSRMQSVDRGHLMIGPSFPGWLALEDPVIREHIPYASDGTASFACALASAGDACSDYEVIRWSIGSDQRSDVFPTFRLPRHIPNEARDVVFDRVVGSWGQILEGRIVIVGSALVGQDQHLTPLGIFDRKREFGAIIHAHIVGQMLNEQPLRNLNSTEHYSIVVLLLSLSFCYGFLIERKSGIFVLSSSILLCIASIVLFRYGDIVLTLATCIASVVFGSLFGKFGKWLFTKK
ncbi:MAG: CHASE2 domain-containing protein [Pseudomonadota bacterium]